MLALLPLDPASASSAAASQPSTARAQLGLAAQPRGEGDVVELDAEAAPELAQRAQLVQLAQAVDAVAGGRARRDDEPGLLEVAEHPRRPAGVLRGVADVERIHRPRP